MKIQAMKIQEPISRLTRWKMRLAEHDCLIDYIPGKENVVADALSRIHKITTRRKPVATFKAFEHVPVTSSKCIALLTSPDLLPLNKIFHDLKPTITQKGKIERFKLKHKIVWYVGFWIQFWLLKFIFYIHFWL